MLRRSCGPLVVGVVDGLGQAALGQRLPGQFRQEGFDLVQYGNRFDKPS
jgi:hypothetical protein